uniref:Helicase-like transcription factor n=1 Tax=Gadus morhua TaxID=8049 RepID=A0A8C5F7T1_GADMO
IAWSFKSIALYIYIVWPISSRVGLEPRTWRKSLSQAIRAAASEEPDADGSVLFGQLQGSVVGIRYYTGVVNPGEMVALVRQPNNPYDRNAVMVTNADGNQVGHIKKELAAAMAVVMDSNLVKVEGVVPYRTNNAFNMPVTLSFWGTKENNPIFKQRMAVHGFKFNSGRDGLCMRSSVYADRVSTPHRQGIIQTIDKLKNAFDDLFDVLVESKDGEKEASELVSTSLMPHQKQALSWMCACENSSKLPPFWEERGGLYYNSLTFFSAKERPQRVRGGILADDMGLGKTLTTIALILTNFHQGMPLPVKRCVRFQISSVSCIYYRMHKEEKPHTNTIKKLPHPPPPLPCVLLYCEQDQFEQHVHADVQLNVYLYYGPERNRSASFLASQDVVLTTYNVLAADHNTSPLHAAQWLRVVLDEGHMIRNPNTQMGRAVLQLQAQRRWILSGTPIQNSLKDLWMLLAFLRLKPFDIKEWWNRIIQRPVSQGDRAGLSNLQTIVRCITLRRTKSSTVDGRPLVALPEKMVCMEQVELTQQERDEYELARLEGQGTISSYMAVGTVLSNYADVLAILMRLRQHCCHPDLLARITSDLTGGAGTPAELRERLVEKLRSVLASGFDEECAVCLESVRLPVITPCAHVYCRPCIAKVVASEQEGARCPLCRSPFSISQLVEVPPEELDGEDNGAHGEGWRTSSKVEALLGNLVRIRSEDSSIKSLVVSQFTRFLSILETPLREQGFSFVRLDGTLSQKRRAQVIQEFQSSAPDSPVVMLLSLRAGGVGLNLTAASRVFLMEPAWNPAAEEQCIDRCHRMGQTRKVFVTKFIVKDSVEENMVKIQRGKQDLVEKAFGSKNTDRKASRIDDIRALMDL